MTLLDNNSKKTAFLQQAVIELDLKNVKVATARVEAFEPAEEPAAITSRAFAELADFVGLTKLLAPGWRVAGDEGQRPDAEMNKLPTGVSVTAVHRLDVPGSELNFLKIVK